MNCYSSGATQLLLKQRTVLRDTLHSPEGSIASLYYKFQNRPSTEFTVVPLLNNQEILNFTIGQEYHTFKAVRCT